MLFCKHVNDKEEKCKTRAIYNIKGGKALYCKDHKKEDMIDVLNKKCIEKDCETQPNYNIKGEKPLYCAKHRKDGMFNVRNKRCIEKDCETHPNFNIKGEKPLYCKDHKKEGMIDVRNKTCIEKDCETQPIYNIKGGKPLYCFTHKKEDMFNVKSKKCLTPLCDIRPTKEGYCSRCFYFTFPDKTQTRNYKSKEILVTNYIKDNFKDYEITYDQIITNSCSRRRPDIFIELYTHCIIVEVDEDQHLKYDSTCENKRIVELYQDLGYRNIIYIRFNPDKYKDENFKTIRSCFSRDTDGKIKIGSTKDWNHRLEKLKECIAKNIENIPSKAISYEYLFYNATD